MSFKKEEKDLLYELLHLSGLELTEDEDEVEDNAKKNVDTKQKPEKKSEEDEPEKKNLPDDDKSDEELGDEWEVKIYTGSRFKIKFYKTFVKVTYRGKLSSNIQIPVNLRKYTEELSSFMNDVLTYVEKVS